MIDSPASARPVLEASPTAVGALLEALRVHHPDMSGLTVISMTGRSRDLLHRQIHLQIGGLLPTVLTFDDYRMRRIAAATGLAAVAEEEAWIRFHLLRCRMRGDAPSPADSERLLAFLAMLAHFSVDAGELRALEGISSEQLARIDGFFTALGSFRSDLAAEGRFYPPFEEERFAGLAPGEGDFFFGLPLMTPANQHFFGRIRRERLFVDAPLFGPHMPAEPPGYETALALIRRIGLRERRDQGEGLHFTELSERAAIPALLASEIAASVGRTSGGDGPLLIVPLDERLSFYLWQFLFRPLGGQVNFAPWLPFVHFAAAHRLREAVRSSGNLASVRRELVSELASRWNGLDDADRAAFETAVTLCDELIRLRSWTGAHWAPLAEHLIAARKLRVQGRRSAPIQVIGMGDATGIPYGHAVILPMNSSVFPRRPFRGPYLNWIHLPRIHRAQFEADDLALRQFLAFGRTAHLAALYDPAVGEAPSAHFSFLTVEFGRKPVKRRLATEPLRAPQGAPAIENTMELREALARRIWSFTTLSTFFTCPYRFILEEVRKVTPPPCFGAEEHASLLIGNLLHRLFARLKDHPRAIEQWPGFFEEFWEHDAELRAKLADREVHRAIVRSYLADIAGWERESGDPILFSDAVIAAEIELTASFGGGQYQLGGRIDRLQDHGGKPLIVDLKYREPKQYPGKRRLADLVDRSDVFDERFQLLIYTHLAVCSGAVSGGPPAAVHLFLRPAVRGDYVARLPEEELNRAGETLERVAGRLSRMLSAERFTPNYRAAGCAWCPYRALCLRPDLYRSGGRR
jgi:hypothetical protein